MVRGRWKGLRRRKGRAAALGLDTREVSGYSLAGARGSCHQVSRIVLGWSSWEW